MRLTMHELMMIAMALPKCVLEPPNDAGCQFIRDRSGNLVGEIHWVLDSVAIYEEYPYHKEAIRALEESTGKRFKDVKYTNVDKLNTTSIPCELRQNNLTMAETTKILYDEP